ncbi:hypothetical protein [Aurantiacibacter gilvus]|uniref:Uncharacterized protein n=1 Tax=Aurantiacibacter gilvus TaxID=3139141 RepID=A0ABU9IHW6_9SPHN
MFDYQTERYELELASPLVDLLPDSESAPPKPDAVQPEARGFELPARIWLAMVACYGLFLASMVAALGSSGKALLSIAVSIVYVTVFFAVSRIMVAQNPGRAPSPLDRDGFLMTHFGPMDRKAVYGQILVVPLAVALFGMTVAAIIVLRGGMG